MKKHHIKTEAPAASRKKARRQPTARKTRRPAPVEEKPIVDTWDESACKAVIDQLWELRGEMLAYETILAPFLANVDPSYQASARNFAHYLKLRQSDQRPLQEWLSQVLSLIHICGAA